MNSDPYRTEERFAVPLHAPLRIWFYWCKGERLVTYDARVARGWRKRGTPHVFEYRRQGGKR